MEWYRRDKEAVAAALQRGERPDLATTMASGPLDELVVLHEELGIFAIVEQRERAGVPDDLLLRTLATLPFVNQASLSGASEVLFREPVVLPQLGNAPAVIYIAGCYGVFALEELLSLLGSAPRESLLPALSKTSSPYAPT